MRNLLLLAVCALGIGFVARGGETVLPGDKISTEYLTQLFEANGGYTVAPPDSDGDIRIKNTETGASCWADVNKGQEIKFFSVWNIKDEVSELRKLRFVNEFNRKFRVVKASVGGKDQTAIVLEYDLLHMEGITDKQILNALERFISLSTRSLTELDKDFEIIK